MPDVALTESLERIPNKTHEFDVPPLDVHSTDVVDSMSPPDAAECISAQRALARDCAALRLIDEDIQECQMRIARAHAQILLLGSRRNAVEQRVFIHRARLSPIRTIPDQVLQEIFQHCLPDTRYVVPNARCAPLVLTLVCRRWRAVAHGTSELWSSIALYDRGVWNPELEVEMVKRWLDRSYMRPLRMSITCPSPTGVGTDGDAFCSDILHLATVHSAHLGEVRLNVSKTYLHRFMNHAPLPELRSLVVSLHQPTGESPTPPSISAPNLRHLSFIGGGASTNLFPRTVLPQITHLDWDCNIMLELFPLFQNFHNLQRLTLTPTLALLHSALHSQLPPRNHHMVLGPSLLHLKVRLDKDILDFGEANALDALLDLLELPVLRTFTIVAPIGYTNLEARRDAWVHSSGVYALLDRSRYARLRLDLWEEVEEYA